MTVDVLGIPTLHLDIQETIGRGGFAVVYRAFDTKLNRPVALKVLTGMVDEAALKTFEQECRIHGPLSNHPGIVTVYDAGYTSAGSPYLVMEYVEGGTLSDRVADSGPIPWAEAVDLLLPVCRAVQAAHDRGVLHRDIKPSNILLGVDGPKLADFGIACGADATSPIFAVSWLHAAPESQVNTRDERSDVYSLGSTLYELLTGRAPFASEDGAVAPVLYRLLSEPAASLPPTVAPAWLDRVVQRCLAKDPAHRPQTANDLLAELAAGEAGVAGNGAAAASAGAAAAGAALAAGATRIAPAPPERAPSPVILAGLTAAARSSSNTSLHGPAPTTAAGYDQISQTNTQPLRTAMATPPFPSRPPQPPVAYSNDTGSHTSQHGAAYGHAGHAGLAGYAAGYAGYAGQDGYGHASGAQPIVDHTAGAIGARYSSVDHTGTGQPFVGEYASTYTGHDRGGRGRRRATFGMLAAVATLAAIGALVLSPLGDTLRGEGEGQASAETSGTSTTVESVTTTSGAEEEEETTSTTTDSSTTEATTSTPEEEATTSSTAGRSTTTSSSTTAKPPTVAKAPIPDVVGDSAENAIAALKDAGFDNIDPVLLTSETVPEGVVLDIDPGAGTSTRLDATVELVVSSGPAPVEVPFVVGMHRDEAISTLEEAGFLVAEESVELEPGSGNVNLVVEQDPADGTAPRGSTVTIFVGFEPDILIGE